MRLGFVLPQAGPLASPDTLIRAAQRAEALGYDSLWVLERLLYPIEPRTPYAPRADGKMPEEFRRVFDPLEALTFVAAHTSRIALGTSVLDMPFHNPLILARQLATLDVLSRGRLRVGLGQGWSEDEFEATGASFKDRGRRADEFIQVLKAVWTTDPVAFDGEFFRIPRSVVDPKPVQRPHPPIYLAAFAPGSLARVGRLADGWNPVAIPADAMGRMMDEIRAAARAAGRDPNGLELIVRANLELTQAPLGDGRGIFSGSLEEIEQDIRAVRAIGATEIFFDPIYSADSRSEEGFLGHLERIPRIVQRATGRLARTA